MNRVDIYKYVKDKYGTEPEYPWNKFPNFAVFRHRKNNKWYGLIADVSKAKLGLDGSGYIDILNVKCEPELTYILRNSKGILPAYHMNKEHWITILLNGLIPDEQICQLIDMSYELTKI